MEDPSEMRQALTSHEHSHPPFPSSLVIASTVTWFKSFLRICLLGFFLVFLLSSAGNGQTPWEYNPYRVNVWISVSPNVGWSEASELESHRTVLERLEAAFGGAWNARVQSTPDSLYGSVLYRIDELTVQQVLARELTMVVGTSDAAKAKFLVTNPPPVVVLSPEEKAKREKMSKQALKDLEDAAARAASLNSVRTFESVLDRIDEINIMSLPYAGIQRDIEPFLNDPKWKKFSEKLRPYSGNLESIANDLEQGNIIAALVGKTEAGLIKESCRPIPARLPWQPESLLRDYDKIFLTSIDRVEEMYRVRVKELDSSIRRLGPLGTVMVSRREDIPIAIDHLLRRQFNPTVRIEENDNSTAIIRVRAAGLINRDQHPASFALGDVMVPYIRRDDSNGNPTFIQSLPFTYIVATEKIDQLSLMHRPQGPTCPRRIGTAAYVSSITLCWQTAGTARSTWGRSVFAHSRP
jgi:hypothetical protein